jgi:hypothetical protein
VRGHVGDGGLDEGDPMLYASVCVCERNRKDGIEGGYHWNLTQLVTPTNPRDCVTRKSSERDLGIMNTPKVHSACVNVSSSNFISYTHALLARRAM